MRMGTTALRRSARLRGLSTALSASSSASPDPTPGTNPNKKQRRSRSKLLPDNSKAEAEKKAETKTKTATKSGDGKTKTRKKKATTGSGSSASDSADGEIWCLPRTQEMRILSSSENVRFVMGVDEAGRGPLAGPVVAAAAIVPSDIDGVTDSKKITKEDDREALYEAITNSPNVRWAVAVMDAPFIDQVNILQATMRGMSAASTALAADAGPPSFIQLGELKIPIVSSLTIEQRGCYVITSNSTSSSTSTTTTTTTSSSGDGKKGKAKAAQLTTTEKENYRALVDGNRIPPDMPCESESIVKGDSKEYAIAAASILAKVSRDRLMRDYHNLWPHFGLERHKGYPTAAHMKAVITFGASPIHRRTFKPLKDMIFDKDGKIID